MIRVAEPVVIRAPSVTDVPGQASRLPAVSVRTGGAVRSRLPGSVEVQDLYGPGGDFEAGSGWDNLSNDRALDGISSLKLPVSLDANWSGGPLDLTGKGHIIRFYADEHIQGGALVNTGVQIRIWSTGSGPLQPSARVIFEDIVTPVGPFDSWVALSWDAADWTKINPGTPLADLADIVKGYVALYLVTPGDILIHVGFYFDKWTMGTQVLANPVTVRNRTIPVKVKVDG